ncbi:MAG TPA: J domain-containing protein [Dehalococcoidia bacterium]|nr:J domain-containing protein [Dehalococcoidia bacterium]
MTDRDYYEILGLTPRADGMMVDQAYWHLARKYQALAQTNPGARIMLDELNEAYGVLGTPRLREQYDAFRDEVLVRKGMIQPVTSKPKRPAKKRRVAEASAATPRVARKAGARAPAATGGPAAPRFSLLRSHIRRQYWPWYAGAAVTVATVGATALLSLGPLLIVGVACAAVALAASRTLKRSLPAVALTLPEVSTPNLRASARDAGKPGRADPVRRLSHEPTDDAAGAGELRASTAAMISRWRSSVGLKAPENAPKVNGAATPSTTLMDIVSAERRIDGAKPDDEPLAAVIEILRGSPGRTVETK